MTNMLVTVLLVLFFSYSVVSQTAIYTTAPTVAYTFDSAPTNFTRASGNFTWAAGGGVHTGLARFDGQSNCLNVANFRDRRNTTFPTIIGGDLSFETWINAANFTPFTRVFDISNGPAVDNIWAGQYQINGFAFAVYGNATRTGVQRDNVWSVNQWQHFLCSVRQTSPRDNSSALAANAQCFLNGVLIAAGATYLPRLVPRTLAYVGCSPWIPSDPFLNASLDSLYYYNYALGAEEAAVHFTVPTPPIFELAFSVDPRLKLGFTNLTAGYGYVQVDTNEFNGTAVNTGVVTFNGRGEYIDIGISTGRYSVGAIMPQIGSAAAYSFEAVFKIGDQQFWGRIFDLSVNQLQDAVQLAFNANTDLLEFVVRDISGGNTRTLTVIEKVLYNQYYHVVVTVVRNATDNTATYSAYVNGVRNQLTTTGGYWIRDVSRPQAYLGRSAHTTSADEYFNGTIDAFRVYDYALSYTNVQRLYSLVQLPPLYASGTKYALTFDAPLLSPGTNYSWSAGAGDHTGIASFNGINQMIDLHTLSDRYNRLFPYVVGGSFAVECWISFTTFATWGRMFEAGSVLNGGPFSNGLVLSSYFGTDGIRFESIYPSATTGVTSGAIVENSGIQLNSWVHIVCSSGQRSANDTMSATSAIYSCFINGQQRASQYGRLSIMQSRLNAWIGRSLYSGDSYLNAMMDSFYYYDRALQLEDVRVHRILTRPPVVDLSFALDPRVLVGINPSEAKYDWRAEGAPVTFNGTTTLSGAIVLDGRFDRYINLAQTRGPFSVGVQIPMIGGAGSGSAAAGNAGWTIEVVFNAADQQFWGRVFDISQGFGRLAIALYFSYGTDELDFLIQDQDQSQGAVQLRVIPTVVYGTYYHVVITIQPLATPNSIQTAFVNGVRVNSITNGIYPRAVQRPFAFLGRSSFDDELDQNWNGTIDAFRVYDYVLSDTTIASLYALVRPPAVYSSAPISAFTFDAAPTVLRGSTNYSWIAGSGAHTGIASFNGVSQSIDLYNQPDRFNRLFPNRNGGSQSVECWIKWNSFGIWPRIIELSNGDINGDNFVVAALGDTNGLALHVYNDRYQTPSTAEKTNIFTVGQWYHVICSITAVPGADPNNLLSANYLCAVDGSQVAGSLGVQPELMMRTFAYIGRSGWAGDTWLNAEIDSWYYYNYGLSAEIAAAHYYMPMPPIFELAFSSNPMALVDDGVIRTAFKYGWVQYDQLEFNSTYNSNGILTLNGYDQYVDLATASGPYSVGTLLPQIGGAGNGTGATRGWTFEVLFKTPDQQVWARVFDFSASINGVDNIFFGFEADSQRMIFLVNNQRVGVAGTNLNVISNAELARWYHVVIVVAPTNQMAPYNYSVQTPYVNGVAGASITALYPDWVPRPLAYIGRSSYGNDQLFNGSIDVLRVYNYALDAQTIANLYTLTYTPALGNSTVLPPPRSSSSSSSAIPRSSSVSSSVQLSSSGAFSSSSSRFSSSSLPANVNVQVTTVVDSLIVNGTTINSPYFHDFGGPFSTPTYGFYWPFAFSVTVNDTFTIDLCSTPMVTEFDPGMYIFQGAYSDTIPSTITYLAYDDDSCVQLRPKLVVQLVSGRVYTIVISSYINGVTGDFTLAINRNLPPTIMSSSAPVSYSSSVSTSQLSSPSSVTSGGSMTSVVPTSSSSSGVSADDDGGVSMGLIIGGIIGGLVLIIIIAVVAYYIYQRSSSGASGRRGGQSKGGVMESFIELNSADSFGEGRTTGKRARKPARQ